VIKIQRSQEQVEVCCSTTVSTGLRKILRDATDVTDYCKDNGTLLQSPVWTRVLCRECKKVWATNEQCFKCVESIIFYDAVF